MSSLIYDFQLKMLDKNYTVTDLLRVGLILANKLKSDEIKEWVNKELYGYKVGDEIPDYRKIPVYVKFYNPVRGWCPVVIQDQDFVNELSKMKMRQSISELEMHGKNGKEIYLDMPVEIKKIFSKQISFDTDINYVCNSISLLSIVESVKNKLLEWILKLEENDVVDTNMIFNKEQIEKAQGINTQIINNFYGDKGKIDVNQSILKE